ncbi:RNA-protein complex protein Nop10 [Candidatus Woesearchaeota archaeon]|nr:RNA-protein complex protein Nop10 [Candidatus Woesearchaeota archaeon]
MKVEILRCSKCYEYTTHSICSKCSSQALTPKPAKFSPEDPYGKYRRIFKKQQRL